MSQPARAQRANHQIQASVYGRGGEEIKHYRYRDVLNLAYQHGFSHFEQAEPIRMYLIPSLQGEGQIPIFVAEVYAVFREPDGTIVRVHGVGDASYENTNSSIRRHLPRQANTRAKARALADALNLDANVDVEFDFENDEPTSPPKRAAARKGSGTGINRLAIPEPNGEGGGYACEGCGAQLRDDPNGLSAARKAAWSMHSHGKILCYRCAKQG